SASNARQLLRGLGKTGVVHRSGDQVRAGKVLELADAAAECAARSARGALEAGNLRCGAVGPAEAEARAEIHAARHLIVAHAEHGIHKRIELRVSLELRDVGAEAVREVQAW